MGSKALQDQATVLTSNKEISEEALPSIPEFPENLSMRVDGSDSVEVNEPLMREQLLNMIHDPEITDMVDADWKTRGVDAFVAKGIEVMHYVQKSAYSPVKSGALATRLRAKRDTSRTELRTTQQQLKEKEKSLTALKKFSGEVQQKIEKVEKETAEVQQKVVSLTKSLKKAEVATAEAKKMAEDAK